MSLINPTEECLAGVFKEFGTTKERVEQDVELLKQWLEQQPHLPQIQDERSVRNMYVRCKCSVERAKQAWDMHFTLKTALPEFFADRDPSCPNLQAIMDTVHMVALPDVTKEGYRVSIFKMLSKDAADFSPEKFFKMGLMMADIRLQEDSSVGDIYIYDCENVGLAHISKISLAVLKKMEVCASQGYRARIKGVHFINAPPVIDMLMTMIKSVMKGKLVSRHHVHTTLESLYQHVDQDVLPLDYGGKAKALAELAGDWRKKSDDWRAWFLDQETAGKADESKRPGKSVNTSELFGFEGTFKQLSVD